MKKIFLSFLAFTLYISISAQSDLVITEIMYNSPEAGTDSLEFIEIYNKGTVAINLNNYTCTGGVYTFPNVSLNPGAFYLIAINMSAFNNVYGFPADGQFTSALSNAGENIVLKDDLGNVMDSVLYDDTGIWPSGASAGNPDGGGSSIVFCALSLDNNIGSNWWASTNNIGVNINGFAVLASPGTLNNCCVVTFGIDPITACDSLTWTNGVTYYVNNFTAKDTLTNTAGCDSIVTLDLAVNYSTPGITPDIRTGCDSLVWTNGVTYYTNNSSAKDTIQNATGCDSVVVLNLTIVTPSPATTDIRTECDSLTWTNGITYYTNNSTAKDTLVNAVGCDSVVTLNLTINASPSGTVTNTICNKDSIIVNGTTYNVANPTGTEVFTNVGPNGCDSTVTVALNFFAAIDTSTSLTNFTITSNETIAGATTYRWLDCDNNNTVIPNEIGVSYTATTNGTYAVEITVGSCIDTSACVAITGVGLNGLSLQNVSLYPNPTTNTVTVDFGNHVKTLSYTVISIEGRIVKQVKDVSDAKVVIDLSNESKGLYFLKVEMDSSTKSYKLIKE